MANMKWKDWAELIGLAAIVASLVFVGLQMRQEQDIARAEALSEFIARSIDYDSALAGYSDILVKGNSGAKLDDVEQYQLRVMIEAAENRVFLQLLAMEPLGVDLTTEELKFASFLHRNPVARSTWLMVKEDIEQYVDPLRSQASLQATRSTGSAAFRERIETYLARLDELHR